MAKFRLPRFLLAPLVGVVRVAAALLFLPIGIVRLVVFSVVNPSRLQPKFEGSSYVFRPWDWRWQPKEYAEFFRSARWKELRQEALLHYKNGCAVCDDDYRERRSSIRVHHYSYRKDGELILGKETVDDLCLLCKEHHIRGDFTKEDLAKKRDAYRSKKERRQRRAERAKKTVRRLRIPELLRRLRRFLFWIIRKLWNLFKAVVRRAWRTLRWSIGKIRDAVRRLLRSVRRLFGRRESSESSQRSDRRSERRAPPPPENAPERRSVRELHDSPASKREEAVSKPPESLPPESEAEKREI